MGFTSYWHVQKIWKNTITFRTTDPQLSLAFLVQENFGTFSRATRAPLFEQLFH